MCESEVELVADLSSDTMEKQSVQVFGRKVPSRKCGARVLPCEGCVWAGFGWKHGFA